MNQQLPGTLIAKIALVHEFHEVFEIGNEASPTILVHSDVMQLRHRLMAEENDEYLEAAMKGNIVEVADALGDQLYILFGTILKHGLQHKIEDVFDEIHRSNMSKLDENGRPVVREDGKILKSDLYFKPDISGVLTKETTYRFGQWYEVATHPPTQEMGALIGYSHNWIHPDFNPKGQREFFVNGEGGYTTAKWVDFQDSYYTTQENPDSHEPEPPTHWMPYPQSPTV